MDDDTLTDEDMGAIEKRNDARAINGFHFKGSPSGDVVELLAALRVARTRLAAVEKLRDDWRHDEYKVFGMTDALTAGCASSIVSGFVRELDAALAAAVGVADTKETDAAS